jgi:hypothetical protein
MLDGSSSVPPKACVGKSPGSRVAGGGAAGAGDGGFMEIGVASMGLWEYEGCAHATGPCELGRGGSPPLLDCEMGPALGHAQWVPCY